jgi:hypothetical protein
MGMKISLLRQRPIFNEIHKATLCLEAVFVPSRILSSPNYFKCNLNPSHSVRAMEKVKGEQNNSPHNNVQWPERRAVKIPPRLK